MEDIDHDHTDDIVCPYCSHEHNDSDELADGEREGVLDCHECGKSFRYTADYSVSFCTEKAPCLNNEGEHKWGTRYSIVGKQRFCEICDHTEAWAEGEA